MLESISATLKDIPLAAVIALVGIAVAQLTVQVFALVDLARRPAVVGNKKWVWLLVILAGNLVGAVVYLAVGRAPARVETVPARLRPAARPVQDLLGRIYRESPGIVSADPPATPDEMEAGPPPAIRLEGLSKSFGSVRALDGVDLVVEEGAVFGFLGPNGAGKTTTLRILTGLARPGTGIARVFGHDVQKAPDRVRPLIGYLPDVPGFYGWMTAPEYLTLSGRLHGIDPVELEARIEALLDLVDLAGVQTRIGAFSRGMKQRLGIAQALVHAPRLLLLDEPTSALDPLGRKQVLDTVAALKGRTTIFFSSHILADVERVSDTVAILDKGRVVTQSDVGALKAGGAAHRITLEVRGDAKALVDALQDAPWLERIRHEDNRLELEVRDLESAEREIPRAVVEAGVGLARLETAAATLEEAFVELIGRARS